MLENYLKVALRNLIRNKVFSMVNLLGLALGMACSLLLLLWIGDELAVDGYHAKGDQLYQVMERRYYEGKIEASWKTPGLLAKELKQQFPEVVNAAGYTPWEAELTLAANRKISKQMGHWVGADWFEMFSIPLLVGTPQTALNTPGSLAISRKVAEAYFGSPQKAFGKSIRIDNEKDYQVTAVFENLPRASSERYDLLLNWHDAQERFAWLSDWGSNSPYTHIELAPTANKTAFEAKLKAFLRTYNKGLSRHFDIQLFLHPYQDIYLYGNFTNGLPDGGRIDYVRIFGGVALFILLIACINFMNLATARSLKRAKEVGIRKAIGAVRSHLIGQFLGEALLLALVSLVVAVGGVLLLLPVFNSLTGKQMSLEFTAPSVWGMLLGITVFTGLVAGSYPALFLSSLHPLRVLKGSHPAGTGSKFFRQSLVVVQFVLSMLLLVGSVVVYQQVNLLQTKNLGYERSNLLYLPMEGNLGKNYALFKELAQQLPAIGLVSCMDEVPTGIGSTTHSVDWPGKDPTSVVEFTHTGVGYDFARTLQLKITGREFSRAYGEDSLNYLINETAAQRMGYQSPLGQPLTVQGKTGRIIGVVKDFHFQSLHDRIQPLVVRFDSRPSPSKTILVSTLPGKTKQALQHLEKLCRQLNPALPFSYQFADQQYEQLYQREATVGILTHYFTFLAIFISCLGLFGLAAFSAEQRTKEIGVRKILGASTGSIVVMLSKDFIKVVLLAFLVAAPIAWYAGQRWLDNFAYKIELNGWVLGLAGMLAIGVALLTVSFQTVKAALANPVKSLRNE